MKELSIEEKAKAYDEALVKARNIVNSINVGLIGKDSFEAVFPELKESKDEDEQIRKSLIDMLKNDEKCYLKEIAWLEKQGEQKHADKVSLDFNKGDILYEQKTMSILLVYERNGSWLMTFCDYWMLKEKLHVEFPYENYGFVREMSLVPATKEQRYLLFKKMKEAGYEWDAEKKELKIIDWSKQIKYNPNSPSIIEKSAWSEEEEVKINRIVACLENLNVADNDILLKDVDWLKSLRPQNRWKPSDAQMEALEDAIRYGEEENIGILSLLYNDLKKLNG